MSMDAITKIREEIVAVIPQLLDTDDMWLLPLASKINGHTTAYFVSYYFQSTAEWLQAIKQYLRITRGIAKNSLFALDADEKFQKYADLKKTYEALVERDQPKKNAKVAEKQVEIIQEDGEDI